MPMTNERNKEIQELYDALQNKKVINPNPQDEFYLGNARCTILSSGDTSQVSNTNSSIVIRFRLWSN